MLGSFIKSALGLAASNNEAVRIELRQRRHLKTRLKQAGFVNDAFIAREGAVADKADALRRFLNFVAANNIVHAIWDDPEAETGIGTRLIRGEGRVYDRMLGRSAYEVMKEATVRVPDEEAARWFQWICGGPYARFESNAKPAPEGTPYLALCIDRPRPDGTTVREVVRAEYPNWTAD